MNHYIGEYYRYPGTRKHFKLVSVNSFCFGFECGHWCTDTIFADLIRVKTGRPVNEDLQLELFKN